MLRLTRRKGESIKCYLPNGEVVRFEITRAQGTVGVGIEAPKDVNIIRTELEEEQPCQR